MERSDLIDQEMERSDLIDAAVDEVQKRIRDGEKRSD